MHFLPLAGVLLVAAVACCWRPLLQRRRHGSSGIVLFRSTRRGQNLRDALLVLFFVLLLGQAAMAAGWPDAISARFVIRNPVLGWLQAAGAVLLLAGSALLATAQLHLGAAWRIGIEDEAKAGLVTGGLYRFCRNPIFLALLVITAGYTLLLPTGLSLGLLAGTLIGVRQQVRAEESYLLETYGEGYRAYTRRVGRFLPGLGRLS